VNTHDQEEISGEDHGCIGADGLEPYTYYRAKGGKLVKV
jgi:hypothetical protein